MLSKAHDWKFSVHLIQHQPASTSPHVGGMGQLMRQASIFTAEAAAEPAHVFTTLINDQQCMTGTPNTSAWLTSSSLQHTCGALLNVLMLLAIPRSAGQGVGAAPAVQCCAGRRQCGGGQQRPCAVRCGHPCWRQETHTVHQSHWTHRVSEQKAPVTWRLQTMCCCALMCSNLQALHCSAGAARVVWQQPTLCLLRCA